MNKARTSSSIQNNQKNKKNNNQRLDATREDQLTDP